MSFNIFFLTFISILVLFSVFESALKNLGINRWLFLIVCIGTISLSLLSEIKIFNTIISPVFFLLSAVFIIALLKIKTIKSIPKIFLGAFFVILFSLAYNAINWSSFEYFFVQPYIYMSILLGFILFSICKNVNEIFICLFFGLSFSQLISQNFSIVENVENMVLGGQMFVGILLISFVTFAFCKTINLLFRKTSKRVETEEAKTQTE